MGERRLEIIFAGFGGQGVMVMGEVLAFAALAQGLEVTWMPSYGPEQRGGTANCAVVVSRAEIACPIVVRPHVALVMNTPSFEKFEPRVVPHGVLLVNATLVPDVSHRTDIDAFYLPCIKVATDVGNERTANMVMLGALLSATGVLPVAAVAAELPRFFQGSKASLVEINEGALEAGFELIPSDARHALYFPEPEAVGR